MSTHFNECFDIEEHNEIIGYLEGLYEYMSGESEDQYMIKEAIIHIEFLYNSAKDKVDE